MAVVYEGRQIYFVPVDYARTYFTDLEYICLDRQTTADFLTSLTSPAERVIRPGFESRVPRTPDEFVQVWKKSDTFKKMMQEISDFEETYPEGGETVQSFQVSRQAEKASLMYNPPPFPTDFVQANHG